jgi:hypothetical protein
MKKQFVTYEIALALKKLGFKEPCIGQYDNEDFYIDEDDIDNPTKIITPAPLWQQAIQFIEDELDIQIEFVSHGYPKMYKHVLVDGNYIVSKEDDDIPISRNNYELCKQAILKAIELCRKN